MQYFGYLRRNPSDSPEPNLDFQGYNSLAISEGVAKAIEEGYAVATASAYHGYFFQVLKGQGPAAPLGELD